MCFLTVSSRPCLETNVYSILRTPFAGHCLGALWGGKLCPAELSEGVNRVFRTLSGDTLLPILQTPSAGHCLDTHGIQSSLPLRRTKIITAANFTSLEFVSGISALWLPNRFASGIHWSRQVVWAEDYRIPYWNILGIILGNFGGGIVEPKLLKTLSTRIKEIKVLLLKISEDFLVSTLLTGPKISEDKIPTN